jgi:type IV secretion system protein VirD4
MSAVIPLGRVWDWKHERAGKPVTFDFEKQGHFALFAPPGSGKGAALEIPALCLGLRDCSVFSVDPSGQNAAVCAEARRRIGNDVLCLNPFGLHVGRYPDLQSCGFNPVVGIDPRSFTFLQSCQAVGEALIKLEGKEPHWPQSARGLITGIIMWEVVKAFREGRAPLLENVRAMLCEPQRRDPDAPDLTDDEKKRGGRICAGLRFHAAAMIASQHFQIADLAGRFIEEGSREIDSIASTARTQTEWLLSIPMREDLRKNGIGDWGRLLDRPTTVFVIVPSEYLESQEGSVWLRLVILAALRALFGRAGRRTVQTVVMMLSEFAAPGKLTPAEAARSQGRKFGIRLWPVLQDIHQLTAPGMYGPHGHDSFSGQCGATMNFAAGDSEAAEWVSRRCGEEWVKVPGMSQSEQGVTVSYHWQKQRCWSPDDVLGLPDYHGLVTFRGQSRATPVYAEPYIDKRGNIRPEYRRAGARLDPYHTPGNDAPPLPAPDVDLYQPGVTDRSQLSIGNSSIGLLPPPRSSGGGRKLFAKLFGAAAALIVAAGVAEAWISLDHPAPVDPPKVHPPAHHHPVKHVR